jgi:hypothetical protein
MTEAEAEMVIDEIMIVEANVAFVCEKLKSWARHMAARYNAPVYLVGSTLHSPTPRDCDIRIVVVDHYFAARYGVELEHREFGEHHPMRKLHGLCAGRVVRWEEDGPSQAWVNDVAKFNEHLSARLERVMDVQVWPQSHWRPPYPAAIELAAPTPHRFIYTKYCPDPSPQQPEE